MTSNPQSRFQVIGVAVALPASCATCGVPKGPFIDFGFHVDYYGAVIFCIPCAQDLGKSAGLISYDEFARQVVRADGAEQKLAVADTAIGELRRAVDGAVAEFNSYLSNSLSLNVTNFESSGKPPVGDSKSELSVGENNDDTKRDDSIIGVEKPSRISSVTSSDGIFISNSGDV